MVTYVQIVILALYNYMICIYWLYKFSISLEHLQERGGGGKEGDRGMEVEKLRKGEHI